MTRGNDENNCYKAFFSRSFLSSFKSRLSILFHFKKKGFGSMSGLDSACYTKPLPSQVLNILPALISQTSGLNQVHAWLLKKLMLIPGSVTILTFNSKQLIASLTIYTRLRQKEQVRHPLSAVGESHQQLSLGSLPQSSLCKIIATPPQSSISLPA